MRLRLQRFLLLYAHLAMFEDAAVDELQMRLPRLRAHGGGRLQGYYPRISNTSSF